MTTFQCFHLIVNISFQVDKKEKKQGTDTPMGWAPGEAGRCGSQQLRGKGMWTMATAFLFVLEGNAGFMKETVSSTCNVVTATPH